MQVFIHLWGLCIVWLKGIRPLASDLIEEWRAPIIDSMVLSMVSRNMVDLTEFDNSDKGCYLTAEGRKAF